MTRFQRTPLSLRPPSCNTSPARLRCRRRVPWLCWWEPLWRPPLPSSRQLPRSVWYASLVACGRLQRIHPTPLGFLLDLSHGASVWGERKGRSHAPCTPPVSRPVGGLPLTQWAPPAPLPCVGMCPPPLLACDRPAGLAPAALWWCRGGGTGVQLLADLPGRARYSTSRWSASASVCGLAGGALPRGALPSGCSDGPGPAVRCPVRDGCLPRGDRRRRRSAWALGVGGGSWRRRSVRLNVRAPLRCAQCRRLDPLLAAVTPPAAGPGCLPPASPCTSTPGRFRHGWVSGSPGG